MSAGRGPKDGSMTAGDSQSTLGALVHLESKPMSKTATSSNSTIELALVAKQSKNRLTPNVCHSRSPRGSR